MQYYFNSQGRCTEEDFNKEVQESNLTTQSCVRRSTLLKRGYTISILGAGYRVEGEDVIVKYHTYFSFNGDQGSLLWEQRFEGCLDVLDELDLGELCKSLLKHKLFKDFKLLKRVYFTRSSRWESKRDISSYKMDIKKEINKGLREWKDSKMEKYNCKPYFLILQVLSNHLDLYNLEVAR